MREEVEQPNYYLLIQPTNLLYYCCCKTTTVRYTCNTTAASHIQHIQHTADHITHTQQQRRQQRRQHSLFASCTSTVAQCQAGGALLHFTLQYGHTL